MPRVENDCSHLHGEIVIPEHQIDERINEIALELIGKYRRRSPLFVALLDGAAPFASRLMTEIGKIDPSYNPQLDYMTVKTYGNSQEAREPRIDKDLAPITIVHDRQVVILDDMADTGSTTAAVISHLRDARNAEHVETAVLVERQSTSSQAEIVGFKIAETRWLVGMGLDAPGTGDGGGRWLPYVAVSIVQPEVN